MRSVYFVMNASHRLGSLLAVLVLLSRSSNGQLATDTPPTLDRFNVYLQGVNVALLQKSAHIVDSATIQGLTSWVTEIASVLSQFLVNSKSLHLPPLMQAMDYYAKSIAALNKGQADTSALQSRYAVLQEQTVGSLNSVKAAVEANSKDVAVLQSQLEKGQFVSRTDMQGAVDRSALSLQRYADTNIVNNATDILKKVAPANGSSGVTKEYVDTKAGEAFERALAYTDGSLRSFKAEVVDPALKQSREQTTAEYTAYVQSQVASINERLQVVQTGAASLTNQRYADAIDYVNSQLGQNSTALTRQFEAGLADLRATEDNAHTQLRLDLTNQISLSENRGREWSRNNTQAAVDGLRSEFSQRLDENTKAIEGGFSGSIRAFFGDDANASFVCAKCSGLGSPSTGQINSLRSEFDAHIVGNVTATSNSLTQRMNDGLASVLGQSRQYTDAQVQSNGTALRNQISQSAAATLAQSQQYADGLFRQSGTVTTSQLNAALTERVGGLAPLSYVDQVVAANATVLSNRIASLSLNQGSGNSAGLQLYVDTQVVGNYTRVKSELENRVAEANSALASSVGANAAAMNSSLLASIGQSEQRGRAYCDAQVLSNWTRLLADVGAVRSAQLASDDAIRREVAGNRTALQNDLGGRIATQGQRIDALEGRVSGLSGGGGTQANGTAVTRNDLSAVYLYVDRNIAGNFSQGPSGGSLPLQQAFSYCDANVLGNATVLRQEYQSELKGNRTILVRYVDASLASNVTALRNETRANLTRVENSVNTTLDDLSCSTQDYVDEVVVGNATLVRRTAEAQLKGNVTALNSSVDSRLLLVRSAAREDTARVEASLAGLTATVASVSSSTAALNTSVAELSGTVTAVVANTTSLNQGYQDLNRQVKVSLDNSVSQIYAYLNGLTDSFADSPFQTRPLITTVVPFDASWKADKAVYSRVVNIAEYQLQSPPKTIVSVTALPPLDASIVLSAVASLATTTSLLLTVTALRPLTGSEKFEVTLSLMVN